MEVFENLWLSIVAWFDKLGSQIYMATIEGDRWKMYIEGLGNTVLITVLAILIGVAIGMCIAIIKYFARENKKLWLLDKICDVYIAVIRGTPVVLQLLILYTTVFISVRVGTPVAIVGFGLNSGAYVAEIIRSGIMSVDKGQVEAGRSLGLTAAQTMRLIILPQAVKNILPALFNEFIVLFKETAVAGYIAVRDLTKVADGIKGRIFNSVPLFIAAAVYLVVVIGMTALQKKLERRLSKGDNR